MTGNNPLLDDDPALIEPLSSLFERNDARPLPSSGQHTKTTPHGRLKKACRDALRAWSGGSGVIIPVQNLQAKTPDGRSYTTGRPGAGDDFYLILPRGWRTGLPVSIEYKAGRDKQSDKQRAFQLKWEAAGGIYIVALAPEQLVADLQAAIVRQNGIAA
jgi:hypothetical protein